MEGPGCDVVGQGFGGCAVKLFDGDGLMTGKRKTGFDGRRVCRYPGLVGIEMLLQFLCDFITAWHLAKAQSNRLDPEVRDLSELMGRQLLGERRGAARFNGTSKREAGRK